MSQQFLATMRELFNHTLEQQTRHQLTPPNLTVAMRYSLQNGGKRLRPVMLLTALAVQSQDLVKYGLKTAMALEYIHTYSLIHDDLPAMDNDDLRRGQPTSHKKFGEAMAILAGDSLLTDAFYFIANDDLLSAEIKVRLIDRLAQASGSWGMVAGQVADMEAETQLVDYEQLRAIHARKTGALFSFAIEAATIIGQMDQQTTKHLMAFARHFGQAYQIHNDLMDVLGTKEQTGKMVGVDATHHKSTYPGLLGTEQAIQVLQQEVQSANAELVALQQLNQQDYSPLITLLQYLEIGATS